MLHMIKGHNLETSIVMIHIFPIMRQFRNIVSHYALGDCIICFCFNIHIMCIDFNIIEGTQNLESW